MIPVKLTIKGLYSYQEEQEINFERLTQSSIFGIFGSVGSGKSTILEAITFALYGKTDRLNLSGDNRNYNMMNLKKNELIIDYIFRVSGEGDFRVFVSGKRNSKKFDDVKTFTRTAYHREKGDWRPVDVENIPSVIGLSYENFKRTIIIPQGKFQEFLQLGTKDRTQMMKELFNLNKYELYYNVTRLESANNEKLQNLSGQLHQFAEITPDVIKEYENKLQEVRQQIKNISEKLEKQQKESSRLDRIAGLYDKLKKEQEKYQALSKQKEFYEELAKRIQYKEYCLIHFKSLVEETESTTRKLQSVHKELKRDTEQSSELKTVLEEKKKIFEVIKTDYEKKDLIKKFSEDLLSIIKIKELATETENQKARITKGETIIKQQKEEVSAIREKRKLTTDKLSELKESQPDIIELNKIKEWHQTKKVHQAELNKNKKGKETVQKEIQNLKTQIDSIFRKHTEPSLETIKDIERASEKMGLDKKEYLSRQTALHEEIQHLSVLKKLSAYANELSEGKPCPLCGSTHHPEKYNPEDVDEKLKEVKNENDKINQIVEEIDESTSKINEIKSAIRLKKEQEEQYSEALGKIEYAVTEHEKKFAWKFYKNEEELDHQIKRYEEHQKLSNELEDQAEKLYNELEKKNKDYETNTAGIEKIRHKITSLKATSESLHASVSESTLKEHAEKTKDQLMSEKEMTEKKLQRVTTDYNRIQTEIEELSQRFNTIEGRILANRKIAEQETKNKNSLAESLEHKIKNSPFSTIGEVVKIIHSEFDTEQKKREVEIFKNDLQNIGYQIKALKTEIGDQSYSPDDHKKIQEEVKKTSDALTEKNQEQGKLAGSLAKLNQGLLQKKELEKEYEALNHKAGDIKTLKALFKASGFVNYISSVHLQNLCNAANDRFYKLTRQKLSLEITPDNNFQVRDFMNGGKVRSIKTLSGGQTFQAALSLALALSDSIQKSTRRDENFFFLDEGFGSLDKESLDVVFETLKSLRKENRIVGVISHVEEMQQEIDAHLKIENDSESGSKIISSV